MDSATASDSTSDGRTARRFEFRTRLLDAAEALVREGGGVSFSMRALASRAEVSPVTPFNHFGSKRGVLDGIVARSLGQLEERLGARAVALDPIERIFAGGDVVTTLYADDPELYRPVFSVLLGSAPGEPSQMVAHAYASWLKGLRDAEASGRLQCGRHLEVVASQLEVHWIGSLAAWVGGAFDKPTWIDRVRYGTALVLTDIVIEKERGGLERRIAAIEKRLARGKENLEND